MNTRRAAPFLFATLCIGLCAFVLRGQIAARPMPRTAAFGPRRPYDGGPYGSGRPAAPNGLVAPNGPVAPGGPADFGKMVVPKGWHIAAGPARQAVMETVNSQLAAIRTGDADRAWFYQSRGLHRNFPSAQAFVDAITGHYPEFGHAASASFDPIIADAAEDHAAVVVTVRGRNGHTAQGYYLLIKEDGGYKVAGVQGGRAIN